MKRCPTCNSTFDDESLSYCTNDGTVLVQSKPVSADAQATALYTQPPPTVNMGMPPAQEYGALQTPSQQARPRPYGWANESPSWTPPPPPRPAVVGGPQQGMAVASLVLGVVSITIGWCCNFGVLTGPVAVGLGIFALVQIKNNPAQYTGKPLAIIGIVTGALSVVFLVLIILLYGLSFLAGGLN